MEKTEKQKRAFRKIVKARSMLVLDEPFFGSLALRLKVIPDLPGCPTFCTDGHMMGYNTDFADQLTFDEVMGVICHEVLHVADGHPWRRNGRDPEGWNIACDFAIDPMIEASGKQLPVGKHINPPWIGKSAEWIYEQLPKQPKGGCPQQPGGDGAGGKGFGEVWDDVSEDAQSSEADWQIAVLQAAQIAQQQGKLPSGLERLVESIKHPAIDWRSALRRFIQRHAKHDYTWRKPNRRYVTQGMYLPSVESEIVPPLAYGWDASGSRDDEESRAEAMAELIAIFHEVNPEKLYVLAHDTEVYEPIGEFEAGDDVEAFTPGGGGGTDFCCLFEYIEEHEIEPCCLIVITDLMGDFPDREPEYPVLWVATTDLHPPFGEVLRLPK